MYNQDKGLEFGTEKRAMLIIFLLLAWHVSLCQNDK